MTSQEKMQQRFGNMIRTLSYQGSITENDQNYLKVLFKEDSYKNKKPHFWDISHNLMMTKATMLEIVKKYSRQNMSIQLSKNQLIILKQMEQNLTKLNKKSIFQEKEEILSIYLELLNIKVKSHQKNACKKVTFFLKNIIQAMSSLLKCYFINLEYQNRKDNQIRKKSKSIYSLGLLQMSEKRVRQFDKPNNQDEILMDQIQYDMKTKSIQELITNYMKKQIDQIQQKEEICRICSNKVRIQTIEKHVRICHKKSDLKQKIEIINVQLDKSYGLIRIEMQQINEKAQRSQQQEMLKKIIAALLYKQKYKKQKSILKRSQSMIESNQQRLFKPAWERYLEDYQLQYGNHEALDLISKLLKEKTAIQKNLKSLQMHSLNFQNNSIQKIIIEEQNSQIQKDKNRRNSIQSTDLSQSIKNNISQTLSNSYCIKFNFQSKDCFLQNQSSQSIEENQSSKYQSISSRQLKTQKLKIHQSKQNISRRFSEEFDKDCHKHFISLQQVPCKEEQEGNISLENFQILKNLGQGAFGKVYVVRRKETQDIYALKIITLSENCTQKQLQTIKNQHLIFKKIAGDHLVKAPFSFSQKSSHMFVLEYMPGGDLRQLLQRQVYFQQKVAKFYLAEIILAIQHLHNYQIIHRDLKPQNLVFDQEGHLKLTDFGLSELKMEEKLQQTRKLTQNPNQIKRREKPRVTLPKRKQIDHLIGTPDYIAPEIINHISTTNMTIDWWSLGVMAYELIIGTRPFCADTIEDVILNIHAFNIQWPEIGDQEGMITQKAKDLIQKLLNKDFMNRLGANGVEQIKVHPFFQGINWLTIKGQCPPFKPNILKLKEQIMVPQDKKLRQQIQRRIGLPSVKTNRKLKLQKFVRFDLLGSQTIQSVEKLYSQKTSRLNKLQTLHFLNNDEMIETDKELS